MAGDFLARDFLHMLAATFGDFMAGNLLTGDFLGGYRYSHMHKMLTSI